MPTLLILDCVSLFFSSTGFAYDVDNPTLQVEELAYILKGWLLNYVDPSGAEVCLPNTDESQELLDNDLDYADRKTIATTIQDNTTTIAENTTTIADGVALGFNADQMSDLASSLQQLSVYAQAILAHLGREYVVDGEHEPDVVPSLVSRMEAAIQDVSASAGLWIDNPGLAIVDRPEVPPAP